VWKTDAKQQGSREREREKAETWGDNMTRKNEEMKKEIEKHSEKYRKKQKASKKHGTRKSTRSFGVTFRKYFVIAGLHPQSSRHFV
jgi:hypothetical protein